MRANYTHTHTQTPHTNACEYTRSSAKKYAIKSAPHYSRLRGRDASWQWQRRQQHPDALLGSALRATHKTTTTSAFLPGTGPGPLAFWDWFRFWFVWGVANGPQSHALPAALSQSLSLALLLRCRQVQPAAMQLPPFIFLSPSHPVR